MTVFAQHCDKRGEKHSSFNGVWNSETACENVWKTR